MLPTVVILATGGTIAGSSSSAAQSSVYQPAKVGISELLKAVPHLERVARIEGIQVAQKASYDLDSADWRALSQAANESLAREEVVGVVVTHGTDTMEETAFMLHITVKSDKPVVLVGAMRPATAYSADGPANLFNAVSCALDTSSRARGAMVVMNERIHSARNVVKAHCASVVAFDSRSNGEIGYVSDGVIRFHSPARTRPYFPMPNANLPRVEIAYAFVNSGTVGLEALIATKPAALVHAGVGNGNSASAAVPTLLKARENGIALIRATRCFDGFITRNSVQFEDDRLGITTANDLTPQKARVLAQLALANGISPDGLQTFFDLV